MTHDEASKNHPGGVDDAESFEKEGRMYKASDDPNDGFNALQLHIANLNLNCSAFYQYPRRKWSPDCLIWYENRPLGVSKLGDMMKDISAEAELSQKYTNAYICIHTSPQRAIVKKLQRSSFFGSASTK